MMVMINTILELPEGLACSDHKHREYNFALGLFHTFRSPTVHSFVVSTIDVKALCYFIRKVFVYVKSVQSEVNQYTHNVSSLAPCSLHVK